MKSLIWHREVKARAAESSPVNGQKEHPSQANIAGQGQSAVTTVAIFPSDPDQLTDSGMPLPVPGNGC